MRKSIYVSVYALVALLVSSCSTGKQFTTDVVETQPSVREYSVQSVMWQQNAAEYRALCYQAFNLAKLRLDHFLEAEQVDDRSLAIITDIDETVLDNSPYNAKLIEEDKEYTQETWEEWTNQANAKAIPGAVEFLNYAASKGVSVFYITNRLVDEEHATIENLEKEGFPYATPEYLMLRSTESAKQTRFDKVANAFNVVMFLGDNLGDFSSEFAVPSTSKRNELTDNLKERFGMDYIVLPNPMYGDWETKGIYKGEYDWSDKKKEKLRRSSIRSY